MKKITIRTNWLILVVLFLFTVNIGWANNFNGSVYSGKAISAKSGKSWPVKVKIVSYNQSTKSVEGEIEWPSLNSVHKIVGSLTGSQFTFKEVGYIKQGSANLNCQYTTTLSDNKISGTWTDPSSDRGTINLVKMNGSTEQVISNEPLVIKGVFPGKVFSGFAKSSQSSQSWPVNLRFLSFEHSTGAVVGEIEWPSLNSVHRIEGIFNLDNLGFSFKEVAYIKKGQARLNCEYTTTIQWDDITGTWTDPGSDKGTIKLSVKNSNPQVEPIHVNPESVYSGKAISTKSGKSWPVSVKIVSFDQTSEKVEGEIEWHSLNAVHKIEGKLSGSQFTFKEVGYIKQGSANLNCQYTTKLSNDKITGTWTDPSSDIGRIELIKN